MIFGLSETIFNMLKLDQFLSLPKIISQYIFVSDLALTQTHDKLACVPYNHLSSNTLIRIINGVFLQPLLEGTFSSFSFRTLVRLNTKSHSQQLLIKVHLLKMISGSNEKTIT